MALFSSHNKRSSGPQRRPSFNKRAQQQPQNREASGVSQQNTSSEEQIPSVFESDHDSRVTREQSQSSQQRDDATDHVIPEGRMPKRRASGAVKVAHVPGAPKERKISSPFKGMGQKASNPAHTLHNQAEKSGAQNEVDQAYRERGSQASGTQHAPSQTAQSSRPQSKEAHNSAAHSVLPLPFQKNASAKLQRRPSVNAQLKEEKQKQAEGEQNPQDKYRAQSPKSDGLSVRMEEKFFGSKDSAEIPADNAVKDALKSSAARMQETMRSFTNSVSPEKAREGAEGAVRGVAVVAAIVFQWIVTFLKRRGKVLAICIGIFLVIFLSAYFPAKDYYVAYRANQRAQNELQANIDHNNALKGEISNLQTQEGVEDFARQNLGMVKPEENSLRLVGATGQSTPDANEYQTNKRIEKDSGTAPVSWKTKFLDFFFGVGDTSKSPNHHD